MQPALGLDPSKRDLVVVVVDEGGRPVLDDLDVLVLADDDSAEALSDLKARIIQHFRRLEPSDVGVYGSARARWTAKDLRPRAYLEAVVMLAAAETGTRVMNVTPFQAAKILGPKVKHHQVADVVRERTDLSGYSHTDRRARALAAAWCAGGIDPGKVVDGAS